MERITTHSLESDLKNLGILPGDTVFVRAKLSAVGRLAEGKQSILDALLKVVGPEGTVVSLSFTPSATILKPDPQKFFHINTPTSSGALPQSMLDHPDSKRSLHPMNSFVAIGKHAEDIIRNHNHLSFAYEPVRKLIELKAKGLLIGCVKDSPGFTTAHLAESDLGLYHRVIFPWLTRVYYKDEQGKLKLFRRKDVGLCSKSYAKFYSYYLQQGILQTGFIGKAFSIIVPLDEAYKIEYELLKSNAKFNVCDSDLCLTCNGRRWDRLHRIPILFYKLLMKAIFPKP